MIFKVVNIVIVFIVDKKIILEINKKYYIKLKIFRYSFFYRFLWFICLWGINFGIFF